MQPLLVYTLCFLVTCCVSQISVDDINQLRAELREEFAASPGLAATTVRLIFHDCSGPGEAGSTEIAQCNGCIDFQNKDHAGLQSGAVEPLDIIYQSYWNTLMNRADFWASAATIALEYSQSIDDDERHLNDQLREIPYFFGRRDCGQDSGDAVDTKRFVDPLFGWNGVQKWFVDNLGYNDQQIVALIGAHTLGTAHSSASGFDTLPWVDDEGTLDNQFYIDLADTAAQDFKEAPYINGWTCMLAPNKQYEWQNLQNEGHPYIMLNSDMSLWYDVDGHFIDEETGECDTSGVIEGVSPVRDITWRYVQSNQAWLDDFADVYELLVQTGYTDLQPVFAGNGRDFGDIDNDNTGDKNDKNNRHGGKHNKGGGGGKRANSVGSASMMNASQQDAGGQEWWSQMQPVLGWMILIAITLNVIVWISACFKRLYWWKGQSQPGSEGYDTVSSFEI
eukprot:CAMPEP_0197024752 /NCGR_PEP_ID=MMETSP1384-20130603/5256_1 /TAXON_ID=29189 /ORGANISM="Ammonia sp." /LENGTH=448 /DNA_ID=CAMNT_0042453193 /DNA_START=19 /DNA_END=1365 /DNA_ORIENTATION=-